MCIHPAHASPPPTIHVGLQLHRSHDGWFPAYFEYLPPRRTIQGCATFVAYQFGSVRGTNCTYTIGYRLSINVRPGDLCSIALKVQQPCPPFEAGRNHSARFTYSEQGLTNIETDGIDLAVYPEPPFVDTLVETFERYVALYRKRHPRIAAPWYHGADEWVCDLYRRDPATVRFGWLLGSYCSAMFYGREAFELEQIEHCLRCSQARGESEEADLMLPYWYEPDESLALVSPADFVARWKSLHATFQRGWSP